MVGTALPAPSALSKSMRQWGRRGEGEVQEMPFWSGASQGRGRNLREQGKGNTEGKHSMWQTSGLIVPAKIMHILHT